MDKVLIRGLTLDASIGVFEWEKQVRQPLVFDLELGWDIAQAAATDDLAYALNYQAVAEYVEQLINEQHYQLLETLLDTLARRLMAEFCIPWLSIRVEKPAVVPQAKAVGLMVERGIPLASEAGR